MNRSDSLPRVERSRPMCGAVLPGNSTVSFREQPIPTPGHGEVLVRTKACTICGSDIRAIYREHLGKGPEGYQGVICGHEPCGQIVECGPGMRQFKPGDRVIVYHISGSGISHDSRMGYMISCPSPHRKAYGWQRDGGMAPYLLAEEKDLIALPDELTYLDGAQVACGFGTAFEALDRLQVSGKDAVLVVGLGPVGLATLMLARALGACQTIGVDPVAERRALAREMGLADVVIPAGPEAVEAIREATRGRGCEKSFDCSGSAAGRLTAIQGTRPWGHVAFVGEGGTVEFAPSRDIIHQQITIHGSWVTSTWRMENLVELLVRWGLHPERLVTHRFALEAADDAYRTMADGRCGKVAVVFDELLAP